MTQIYELVPQSSTVCCSRIAAACGPRRNDGAGQVSCHLRYHVAKTTKPVLDNEGWNAMDRRGNGIYISGGGIAVILIIVLLVWVF